jgi:ribonuclease D
MAAYPEGATDILDEAAARAAAERISQAREIAVDLEADAMHAFRARLCFVQVGTDHEVLLFDTLAEGVRPQLLAPALESTGITKFFHAAGGDLQFLAEAGIRVRGLFDTHRAATLLGWPKVGLADLVRERLGVTLLKEHQQSDFSLRPMPPGMREYIADDVRYLCEVGRQVRDACAQADILEEVQLDCDRLCDEAAARPDIGSDYKPKLNRSEMSPKAVALGLAIADALNKKRVAWAEAEDVPIGRMLSNAAITSVATRPPKDLKSLARAQGVRGPFVRAHGDEVLALISELTARQERGELESTLGQSKPGSAAARRREAALKEFRAQAAAERKVTPSVVLPTPLLSELASRAPTNRTQLSAIPYLGEKRLALYGERLLELLAE